MTPEEFASHDLLGLADLVRTRAVTADELLDIALRQIEQRNPPLNAVNHLDEALARRTIASGLPQGAFTGVPYLLKDLGVVRDGMPTSNGSKGCGLGPATHDSTLVERLLRSGLVVCGKTNTPELGLNASTESAALGPCANPWDLTRSAGGSSGGAAAAVAARMVPAAHATDGGGSIRIPASNCGLFGLKPSRARNPAGPDVGESWSGLATGHAVTRSVRDSAALLDATQGPAPGDPYFAPPREREFLSEVGAPVETLRVALWTDGLAGEAIHPACRSAAEDTAALLGQLGHRVELKAPPVDMHEMLDHVRVIIASNVAAALSAAGRLRGSDIREGEVENATWELGQEGQRTSGQRYAEAIMGIHRVGRRMGGFFGEFDVLLSPTLASPPLPLGTLETIESGADAHMDRLFSALPFTPLFNVTGGTAASLPLGWSDEGLPVGVQLGANPGEEGRLFRLGAQLESARPWFDRAPPPFA